MKKRNIYATAVVLMALSVGLFSCKNEPKKVQEEKTEQTEGITFRFIRPGDDTQLVDVRALQDGPEWAIDQLWMYVFDEKGEKVVEDPINIRNTPDFKFTSREAHYTYKPEWKKDAQYQFLFIANANPPIVKGTTMELIKKSVLNVLLSPSQNDPLIPADPALYPDGPIIEIPGDNGWRIPMVGFATDGNSSRVISIHGNSVVSVQLKRAVARIDILNCIPGFEITDLSLFNNETTFCYIFETPQKANKSNSPSSHFATLDASNTMGKRAGTRIKKAFYPIETLNEGVTDDNIVTLKVTANYDNQKGLEFTIPFKKKDAYGNFSVPVNIYRNHLYTIVLGDKTEPTGGKLDFSIKEELWNAVDFEETLSLIYVTGENLTDRSDTGATLNVADNAAHSYTLQLDNDFANHTAYDQPEVLTGAAWITNAKITPGTGNKATLTFTVAANASGKERTGSIKLKSTANAAFFTLTVKQPK